MTKAMSLLTRPAGFDPANATTTVHIYRKHVSDIRGQGHGANFYVREDCLDWLLSFAADEDGCMGVPPCDMEPDTRTANVPAVADLHVAWQFEGAWRAEFLAGTHKGESRSLAVNDVHTQMWKHLRGLGLVEGYLCHACHKTRKQAAWDMVVHWGAKFAQGEAEIFDEVLSLSKTPRKKRRKPNPRPECTDPLSPAADDSDED